MKRLTLIAGLIALFLVPAGLPYAQEADHMPPVPLPYDQDTDPAPLPLPADEDASAAPDMAPPPTPAPVLSPEQWFQEADLNRDGVLSFEEVRAAFPRLLQLTNRLGPGGRQGQERGPARQPQQARPGDPEMPPPDGPPPPGRRQEPGAGQNPYRMLQRADLNNDGQVTLKEFQKAFPNAPIERFRSLDRNNDGVICEKDAQAPPSPPPGRDIRWQRLQEADTNRDGKISREEAKAAFPNMGDAEFNRRDRNGDGFLSPDDFNEAANAPEQ